MRVPALASAFAVALLVLIGASAALAKEANDLSGKYVAKGVGVGGAAYEADVTLTLKGDTYLIVWKFSNGQFTGVGIRQGDVLSVGWTNDGKAGVVLYTVKPAAKAEGNPLGGEPAAGPLVLDGRWADGSTNGKIYTETLTRRD
ncbi:MAG: hypothetical protein JWM57_855 [Phycisphaerales bacterium]|nr:hypothetical protein [Phycisphaerales bacterium]